MIGPRVGPSIGARAGTAIGPGADELAATSGTPQTTLTVALADSADPVITLVNYNYTCVVTNTGANTASNVTALVTLDPQSTFVSASGTGWACNHSGGVVTCTRATLAVGAAPTITVTVTSPAAAETSSATADADADNAPAATQDSETTVVNLVTRDATKLWRLPANATEWSNYLAYKASAVTAPNSVWKCNEGSGNLADAIGALTLTANGTPNYAVAATGWTRTGVSTRDNQVDGFNAILGAGPDPATTSQIWMFVVSIETEPTAARNFIGLNTGVAGVVTTFQPATGVNKLRLTCVNVSVTGTADHATGSYIFILRYDRAASAVQASSDLETLTGTYSASAVDGKKGYSFGGSSPGSMTCLYGAMWSGANAEANDATDITALRALIRDGN